MIFKCRKTLHSTINIRAGATANESWAGSPTKDAFVNSPRASFALRRASVVSQIADAQAVELWTRGLTLSLLIYS